MLIVLIIAPSDPFANETLTLNFTIFQVTGQCRDASGELRGLQSTVDTTADQGRAKRTSHWRLRPNTDPDLWIWIRVPFSAKHKAGLLHARYLFCTAVAVSYIHL